MEIMIDEHCPVFVGVFAARIQAERAADELRAEGYRERDLGLEVARGGGARVVRSG